MPCTRLEDRSDEHWRRSGLDEQEIRELRHSEQISRVQAAYDQILGDWSPGDPDYEEQVFKAMAHALEVYDAEKANAHC